MNEHANPATLSAQADELEERMMHELGERIATKSVLFRMADGKVEMENGAALKAANPDKYFLMGADARLPKMPKKPTLIDFFNNRFASLNHLLQSATHALKGGHSEKVVLACLLHDIGVAGFIRCDHGYWGAQMIAPYVDEEVSDAIRMHQALRFFPDESVGYGYPDLYRKFFGDDVRLRLIVGAEIFDVHLRIFVADGSIGEEAQRLVGAHRPAHLFVDIGLDHLRAPIAVVAANEADDAEIGRAHV